MIKTLIIRIILLLVLSSSLLSIYRQVIIIRSAQSSLDQARVKVWRLEVQNKALQESLK